MTPARPTYYMHKVVVFRERHPWLGPLFWLLSLQYFIVQIIVGAAWDAPFSLMTHAISDLGNTVCGPYADRYVCSPWHDLMNASFILLGVTVTIGSFFITSAFRKNYKSRLGFRCMALAGIGTIFVGAFPENTVSFMHFIGAALPFFCGNLALIIFGLYLQLPVAFKWYTLLSGMVGLVAFALFLLNHYLGLGLGGMERIVAYPQTIWLIAFGFYVSADRYRKVRRQRSKPKA